MRIEEIAEKNNWLLKKISDVTFYQEGPGVRKNQYTENGVKLLNVGNIQQGNIDLSRTDRFISEEEAYGRYEHFLVDEGDLIIACSGIKVSYFHEKISFIKEEHLPLCMNTSTMRFKVLDKTMFNINYFAYFLKTNYFKKQLQRLITGSAQLNFGPSHIEQIDVMIPPINTQKQIVEVLDQAQSLIDKRKEQIRLLDDLIESIFYDMFGDPVKNNKGWEVKKLRENISILTDYHANGSYEILRENVELLNEESYALMVRTTDLERNNFTDDVKYINKSAYNFLKKSKVYGGDIIINKIGSAGKVYLMPNLNRKVSLGMNQFLLRTNEKIKHIYLYTLFNTERGEYMIKSKAKGAVTKTINKKAINDLIIPIPPIQLQNQFAEKVEQIESQKQLLEESLKLLEDNYDSLMQRAFKGELFN